MSKSGSVTSRESSFDWKSDPFSTFGVEELNTWRYYPGICRFQTSSAKLARKLSQHSKARLVLWSVSGGYLRVFEESMEPWEARRLVKRYLKNGALPARGD